MNVYNTCLKVDISTHPQKWCSWCQKPTTQSSTLATIEIIHCCNALKEILSLFSLDKYLHRGMERKGTFLPSFYSLFMFVVNEKILDLTGWSWMLINNVSCMIYVRREIFVPFFVDIIDENLPENYTRWTWSVLFLFAVILWKILSYFWWIFCQVRWDVVQWVWVRNF